MATDEATVPSELHLRILRLVAAGATDESIAAAEFVSQRTVRRRLQELMRRSGAVSRAALVAAASKHGWL